MVTSGSVNLKQVGTSWSLGISSHLLHSRQMHNFRFFFYIFMLWPMGEAKPSILIMESESTDILDSVNFSWTWTCLSLITISLVKLFKMEQIYLKGLPDSNIGTFKLCLNSYTLPQSEKSGILISFLTKHAFKASPTHVKNKFYKDSRPARKL